MGRRHPGLQRRRDTWHLRRRVPDGLREAVGKTEVVRSLKTHDYRLAVQRATVEAARIDEEFASARKTLTHAHDITDAEAERISVRHFAERDARNADTTARAFGDARAEALEANQDDLNNWRYGRDPEVMPPLQAAARRLVVERGLRVAGTPPGMWSLIGYLRRAEVELTLRLQDRLEGRAPEHRDPMFHGAAAATDEETAPTVEALIGEFMADPGWDLSAKKQLDWGFSLRLLRETAGAGKPLRDVDRADLRRLRDLLVRMPANASKRYPDLTLARAADAGEADGVEPMAAATINSHLGRVASFFRWAQREGHVARNVAEGLRVAKQVSAAEARMPFSQDQLERIFGADFVPHEGARRWVPLICLFMGLRAGEACQLRVRDARDVDGVPCVVIDPEAGPLKSAASRRTVPVHRQLTALGFGRFVEAARSEGRELLFPELPLDRRGYRSDAFQKFFNRHIDRVGARAPRTSLHSFRHCFRDQLRERQVPRDVALQLGGWTSGAVADTYGAGVVVKTLRGWLDRVDYGLDLGHLHTR